MFLLDVVSLLQLSLANHEVRIGIKIKGKHEVPDCSICFQYISRCWNNEKHPKRPMSRPLVILRFRKTKH